MSETTFKSETGEWWFVRLTHPNHHKKVVFRSLSENRARQFLQNRYPRGSEAYLESPVGVTEHYEHERQGELGVDQEKWAAFDPDTWVAPDSQAPPGETAWADKEG